MPLAHILMPQLAQKAKEIEAQFGHAPTGYLENQGAGLQMVGQGKSDMQPYDPSTPMGRLKDPAGPYLQAMGTMQKSKDPTQKAVARGMGLGIDPHPYPGSVVPAEPLPLSPETRSPEPGLSVKGKGKYLKLPKGEVGLDETGQSIDRRGKKLGYLGTPTIVTPYGDTPMRNADRRAGDVLASDRDPMAVESLKNRFGKHLKEMRENVDARGRPTDQFPQGYFKNMSKAQRKTIEEGVKALQAVEREQEKGIST